MTEIGKVSSSSVRWTVCLNFSSGRWLTYMHPCKQVTGKRKNPLRGGGGGAPKCAKGGSGREQKEQAVHLGVYDGREEEMEVEYDRPESPSPRISGDAPGASQDSPRKWIQDYRTPTPEAEDCDGRDSFGFDGSMERDDGMERGMSMSRERSPDDSTSDKPQAKKGNLDNGKSPMWQPIGVNSPDGDDCAQSRGMGGGGGSSSSRSELRAPGRFEFDAGGGSSSRAGQEVDRHSVPSLRGEAGGSNVETSPSKPDTQIQPVVQQEVLEIFRSRNKDGVCSYRLCGGLKKDQKVFELVDVNWKKTDGTGRVPLDGTSRFLPDDKSWDDVFGTEDGFYCVKCIKVGPRDSAFFPFQHMTLVHAQRKTFADAHRPRVAKHTHGL